MRIAVVASLMLALAGCGSGEDTAGAGSAGDPSPAVRTGTVTLQGHVVKGPVAGATVCAYAVSNGARGNDVRLTIAPGALNAPAGGNYCAITLNDGSFSVTVPDLYSGDLLLEAYEGFFCIDESEPVSGGCSAGGAKLRLWNGRLRAVVAIPASGTVPVQLNPLTTAAVDSAGAVLSARTVADRFNALARQVLGAGTTVTAETPANAATHTYLKAAAAHLLAYGTVDQVVAALAQGSTAFLPAPAPRLRTGSAITLDFQDAMRRLFVEGGSTQANLVLASRELTFTWDNFAASEGFDGTTTAAVSRHAQLFDFTDGVHRRTTTSTRYYFSEVPFMVHGQLESDGRLSLTTTTGTLPTAGRLGDSGLFRRYVTYADATKALVVSTTTVDWSLEADTASTLLACLNAVTVTGGVETRAAECLPFTAAGQITGQVGDTLRAVYVEDGFTYLYEYRP